MRSVSSERSGDSLSFAPGLGARSYLRLLMKKHANSPSTARPAKSPTAMGKPVAPQQAPERHPATQLPPVSLLAIPTHAPERGRELSDVERGRFEPRLGRDLSSVRIRESAAADALGARAFTIGRCITFAPGEYHPGSRAGDELLAHELAHVAQQSVPGSSPVGAREAEADRIASAIAAGATATPVCEGASAGTLARKPRTGADRYPWIGRIVGTYSAALRSVPAKDPAEPHANTLADLPKGTFVTVLRKRNGWLRVEATVKGKPVLGWVSQELVRFDRWDALPMREALVALQRAETAKAADPAWQPASDDERERLTQAKETIEAEPKYAIDEASYHVAFANSKSKIQISTIYDLILFVEAVEDEYPNATPEQVISEIRQLWFSDVNWELLVASHGIEQGGKDIDIETEPNPIAKRFDMTDLAPADAGKVLSTPMGEVNIGHVLAGIDARLSGFPSAYPADYLKRKGHHSGEAEFKYQALKEYSGGDARTFSTFAGDLGQAYAEYMFARYEGNRPDVKLSDYVHDFAKPEELRGDLHGYIAAQVAKDVRDAGNSPTGTVVKASEILRDMYLAPKSGSLTYYDYMRAISGKDTTALRTMIFSDSLSFATLWYARLVATNYLEAWNPGELFDEYVRDFAELADKHEASAAREDTLAGIVEELLDLARDGVR